MKKITGILLLTTLISSIVFPNFVHAATETTSVEMFDTISHPINLKGLLGILDEYDFGSVEFCENGDINLTATNHRHDPEKTAPDEEKTPHSIFKIERELYKEQLKRRFRIVVKSETETSIEFQSDPVSDTWVEVNSITGKNVELKLNASSSYVDYSFEDTDGQTQNDCFKNPISKALEDRQAMYKVEADETARTFVVQYNPTPDIEDSPWKTVYTGEGVEAQFISDDKGEFYLSWYHKGRNTAFIHDKQIIHDKTAWGVHYSDTHEGVKVISRRFQPGFPLVYELYVDNKLQGTFDTNLEGFQDFAEVTPIYVRNSLDEFLLESDKTRYPGLHIPVTLYKRGNNPQKPTLMFIKGGPSITQHGTCDAVFHALSYHYNVAVTEYRGSSGNGQVGDSNIIDGDLGGGHNRDIISVLRAIKNRDAIFSDLNPDDVSMLGHCFGAFSLARLMQDYHNDMQGVRRCVLAGGELDILAFAQYCGGLGSHYAHLGKIDYSTFEEFQTFIKALVESKSADNQKISPMFRTDRMPNTKTLVTVGTHDGTVWMEQSLQFVMNWVNTLVPSHRLPPVSDVLAQVGRYNQHDDDMRYYRISPSTGEITSEFKKWWQAIDPTIKASLPMDIQIIEGSNHCFTDTPEIFSQYLETLKSFTS